MRKQTPKVDYLAPFLAIRGITDARDITTEDAIYLRQMCLADLKQRLIDKANLIQKRFEAVSIGASKRPRQLDREFTFVCLFARRTRKCRRSSNGTRPTK